MDNKEWIDSMRGRLANNYHTVNATHLEDALNRLAARESQIDAALAIPTVNCKPQKRMRAALGAPE